MEEKEFVSTVLDCKILYQEEVENVMKNFNGELSTPVDFRWTEELGAVTLVADLIHILPVKLACVI